MRAYPSWRRACLARGSAALLSLIAAAGCEAAPIQLPEIRFTREPLANGLTVILHEDRRVPLVNVNLWYHVGSKDEARGRSGFAHLFEHLMFMGTGRVPTGEFDRLIEGGGGSNNASTSQDRTNYYEEGPSHLLPLFLYLEADRMESFGHAIDREKLDTQRRVVQNERRQSYENRPYGRAFLEKGPLLYPEGHPYREPVIGSHGDLENATVQDVRDFFARFYVPANASLVIAGDFESGPTLARVKEYFGKLPAGEAAKPPSASPVVLDKVVRKTFTDRVQLPRVGFVYHSPAVYAPGDADLDIAAAVLGQGKSSRLYRTLVYEKKVAQDVSAMQLSSQLGSLFEVHATARPGQDLDALERAMEEVLAGLAAAPISEEELERARSSYEVDFWERVESLAGRADLLNQYETHYGDPGALARDLGRYYKVTQESVREWAAKVIRPDARLIMRVVPQTAQAAASPPPEQAASTAPPATEEKPAAPEDRPAPSALLPPKPPAPGAERAFLPTAPVVVTLSNGIPVWVLGSSQVPVVNLKLVMRGAGSASDPAGKSGLAALAAGMLDEGAGERGALDLANQLDLLGATLGSGASRESGEIHLSVLRRNVDRALDIFADVLLRPRFEPKEWDRVKTLTVNGLLQRRDNPASSSRVVTDRVFFGAGHPYADPVVGDAGTVGGIAIEDLRKFYAARWNPGSAVLIATGDISADEIKEKLEKRLGSWKPAGDPAPAAPPPALSSVKRPRLVVVEKPNAPQTVISIALPGRARRDPAYTQLVLASTVFGGSFTSRLVQNLREKHEFTYGASSNFQRLRGPGAFLIQTSVKTDTTGEALAEIARECRGMTSGLRPGELEKAKAAARTNLVEAFSTASGSLDLFAATTELELPPDEPRRNIERMAAAAAADVEKIAREVIRWGDATIVLVGDLGAIEAEVAEANRLLKELPGEPKAEGLDAPVFLDADGRPAEGKK